MTTSPSVHPVQYDFCRRPVYLVRGEVGVYLEAAAETSMPLRELSVL